MEDLFNPNREGISFSGVRAGFERYQPGIDDRAMLDRMAEEHRARIEAVRLPDGTVPEMIYPIAEDEIAKRHGDLVDSEGPE